MSHHKVSMPTTNFNIVGMHCNSCKMLIEDVVKDVPGVQDCSVYFDSGKASITHDGSVDADRLKKEIESLGTYKVEEAL